MGHTEEERRELYGCDGKCYWPYGMCPRVEFCEETKKREFVASWLSVVIICGIALLLVSLVIILL